MKHATCTSVVQMPIGVNLARTSSRLQTRAPTLRVAAADGDKEAQMKAMQEAMNNPEVAARMKALEEQMKQPEVQQQMNQMASVMQNPAFMEKMAALREDPELKPVFDEIKAGGMAAMMKWMNDPGFLAKIGEKMGDVAPPIAAAAPAAPIEVNDILDAAKAGDLEAIEDYCAIGKGNEKDPEGRSALHYAVAYNRLDAVKALLDNGAQVGAIDSKGNTALHYASGYARKDCIDALIAAGADVGVANEGGQKPVDVITEEPRNPLNQDEALLAKLRG